MQAQTTNSLDLLLEIAKCPNFINCENTPCEKVVKSQQTMPRQVPEPWNGRAENASLIFLSSNPSYTSAEIFPTRDWSDLDIIDFFNNRFSSAKGYVKNNIYVQLNDGTYAKNWVRFWARIRNIASLFLQKSAEPGIDYLILEIVRCKSLKEIGVVEAAKECSSRYLARTLNLCRNANFLFIVGNKAANMFRELYNVTSSEKVYSAKIGERDLLVIEIPHPTTGRSIPEGLFDKAKSLGIKISGS